MPGFGARRVGTVPVGAGSSAQSATESDPDTLDAPGSVNALVASAPLLLRRPGDPYRSRDQAIEAAGGEWRVMRPFEPAELAKAILANGVRALSVGAGDCAFLAGLTGIEFLDIRGTPDATAFPRMDRLRGLSCDSGWLGRLDFRLLPNLEWLSIGGADRRRNRGLETLFTGHAKVRRVRLAGYQGTDLRPLAPLPSLERIEIIGARRLVSLEGARDLAASMTELVLVRCPNLDSLAGVEALGRLRYLRLQACNRVSDVGPVAQLNALVFLDASLSPGVQSLRLLAGHPSLEYLAVGRVLDGDFTPLQTMPRLRMIIVPPEYAIPPGRYRRASELDDSDPVRIRGLRLAAG
jgi:hypothetical protein